MNTAQINTRAAGEALKVLWGDKATEAFSLIYTALERAEQVGYQDGYAKGHGDAYDAGYDDGYYDAVEDHTGLTVINDERTTEEVNWDDELTRYIDSQSCEGHPADAVTGSDDQYENCECAACRADFIEAGLAPVKVLKEDK